ncbi:hypothetical protein BB561_001610 [Smittium simulii]|uniref:SRCR domain-containing protein n=1 Tax=Smittium simulii TaxID=133385 RepID=A0A2T9YTU6_9FUNG|nr:hypothetical protein BB561_001610 [Smittium simulii]
MIFNKFTLSAYLLAQALLQISVSADIPRTKVQPYNGPAVTHSVNGAVTICDKNGCVTTLNKDIIEDHNVNVYPEKKEVVFTIVKCKSDIYPTCKNGDQKCNSEQTAYEECVDGKWTHKPCRPNEKCYTLNGPRVTCALGNNEAECKDGTTRCASEGIDSETCSNGKWVRRKCSGNEECKITEGNIAKCAAKTLGCEKGYQKCNVEQTGYDECVNGKLEFKSCGPKNKCYALNGFRILCGPSNDVAECKEGTTRCASEGIDSETCSNGKWVRRKCSGNEECKINKNNVAECTKIDVSVCKEGSTRCAVGNLDTETCSNGQWVTRKCSGNELCKVNIYNVAKCTKIDESVCKEGSTRCASEGIDSETCSNGKWVRRKCSGNEECKINKNNVAECTKIDVSVCKEGSTRCAVGNLDTETCSNGQWVTRKCSGNELCKVNIYNVAKCTKIDESVCKEGSTRCASEGIDSETCSNGKWVRRKCSGNEECKINKNNVAECTKIDNPAPSCKNGSQKCNSKQTGFDECVDGKLTFKPCPPGSKCNALDEFRAFCGAVL